MSKTQNQDGSVSMDAKLGPEGPTNENNQSDFESVSKGLDGEYDSNIEVVGDVHDTDLESYRKSIESKYDKSELDGIAVVGDLTSVPGKDGIETIEEYTELYEENLSEFEDLAESLDTEIFVVDGNNDPAEDALPGDRAREAAKKYASENIDGFSGEDEYKDFVFDKLDRVQNISYDSVDIGDVTLVGGTHHTQPEVPEDYRGDVDLEDFDYDLEEISSELEDRNEPDYGFIGKIPVLGGIVETVGNFFGYGDINVDPEDVDLEELQGLPDDLLEDLGNKEDLEQYLEERKTARDQYNEKKERLEEVMEGAGENVIVLDHGMPFGEGEDFDLDYISEERGHQGSMAWADILEEYEVDSFFGGHFHGKGGMNGDIHGTDVYNVAEGQYMEIGINDGGLDQSYFYDQKEWGGQPKQQERQSNRLMEDISQAGGVDEFYESLDSKDIPEEHKDELREKRDQVEEMWNRRNSNGSEDGQEVTLTPDQRNKLREIQAKVQSGDLTEAEANEKMKSVVQSGTQQSPA